MRVFYVINIADARLRALLSAVRFLSDPTVTSLPHITVRGPYRQRYHLDATENVIRGDRVLLYGPGHFFARGQNTVYLRAYSENLAEVWDKPDYEFNPHLTLYDGSSRSDAIEIYQAVTRFRICVSFVCDGLEPLIASEGQGRLATDIAAYTYAVAEKVARGEPFPEPGDRRKRLQLLERICKELADISGEEEWHVGMERASARNIELASGWGRPLRLGRAAPPGPPRSQESADSPVAEAWRITEAPVPRRIS